MIEEALKYQSMGYSVIPVKKDKKPYVKWGKYQRERANKIQVKEWWHKWPDANIGIITGKISGITVIDIDNDAGLKDISKYISDSMEFPTSKSPRGWHYYFSYQPMLRTGPSNIKGCDIKTDGGYIIAPPSKNGTGANYRWLTSSKIRPTEMPTILFEILSQSLADPASAHERALKKKEYTRTGDFSRLQVTSSDFKKFAEGSCDESLFHIANCLVKGGIESEILSNVLKFLALHCNPPFPEKEVRAKIESALKRNDRRNRNLAEEVRDFVVTSSGFFMTSDVFSRLQVTSRQDKKAVVLELLRLKEKEIIKPHGEKNGCYRKIECDCEPEDWQNACTDAADLWLPFDLDEMVLIPAGGLISLAGEPNSGKTAILLNIAKENRKKFKVHYFSSELGVGAFKRRIEKFSDITPNQWNISFYPRADNFADVIKRGEGNLNIIDFLEIYENFYLVSKRLAEIHKKLDGAVAVIALQKAKGRDDGHGGTFTREKPVLSLSMSPGKVKITKLKEWREGIENPNSKEYEFKLVDGCQFIKVLDWHIPMT